MENKQVYYRLIALWVICEAFAGGIMHGLKIPFTGMVVSGMAVCCIILIAMFVAAPSAIITATVIVAIFKLTLSPHSPPTAYLAVFFQGIMGQLIFRNRPPTLMGSMLLGFLSLTESALQRVIVLIIIYGNDFWVSVNEFIKKVTNSSSTNNYSLVLAALYIGIHAVAGLLTGYGAYRLAKAAPAWRPDTAINKEIVADLAIERNNKKKPRLKFIFLVSWLILLFLVVQSYLQPQSAILPKSKSLMILVRAILIVAGWYLILSPLLMRFLKNILQKQKGRRSEQIQAVMELLPHTLYIFKESWNRARQIKGIQKIQTFFRLLIGHILAGNNQG